MKKQDGRLQHEAVKDSNRQPENETKESRSEYDRLLLWMKTGDMEAFRLLYEKTAGNVYGYALSILKNTQDAEEVMQDTYLVVWNRVEAYEPDGKPMAWLFTIARNLCYMKLRRQNAVSSVSLEEMREQETGWEPGNAPSLFEQINETHAGTLDDPIPYEGNMALTSGKYYLQGGVIYRCIRDTGNPVYLSLSQLVGLYVEVAV